MQREVHRLLDNAISANTRKTYDTGLAAFENFLLNYNIVETWPPNLDTVVQFLAYLSLQGLSARTAQSYTAAVGYKCKMLGFSDITDNFLVKKVLEGAKRTNNRPDTRCPITPELLTKIVTTLPAICFNTYELKLFRAAYTLSFWGLFRVGEIVASTNKTKGNVLLNTDVCLKNGSESLIVNLRMSKTDQRGKGITIEIPKNSKITCAVTNMVEYLKVRPAVSGPLLCHFDGAPLTRYQFSAVLTKTLNLGGIVASNFKAHSFSIGAATALSMAGYSDEKIKEAGRWKSSAYKSYIRPSFVTVPVKL